MIPADVQRQAEEAYRETAAKFTLCLQRGSIEVDAHLNRTDTDNRRGMSLIARPGATLAARITALQEQLREIVGDQYFYPARNMHVTVLSVIPATAAYPTAAVVSEYVEAVQGTLRRRRRRMAITFAGIVASDEAILAKGYASNEDLRDLRADLLDGLKHLDSARNADRRYMPRTAHLTFARFRSSVGDLRRLNDFLAGQVATPIGDMRVEELQLVENDWYMRHAATHLIQRFFLR